MKMSEILYGSTYQYRMSARSKSPGPTRRVRVITTNVMITTHKGTRQPRGVDVEFLNLDGTRLTPTQTSTVPSDDIVQPWSIFALRNQAQIDAAEVARKQRDEEESRNAALKDRLTTLGIETDAYGSYFRFTADAVEKLLGLAGSGIAPKVTEFVFKLGSDSGS
jgi:hypothetical protein